MRPPILFENAQTVSRESVAKRTKISAANSMMKEYRLNEINLSKLDYEIQSLQERLTLLKKEEAEAAARRLNISKNMQTLFKKLEKHEVAALIDKQDGQYVKILADGGYKGKKVTIKRAVPVQDHVDWCKKALGLDVTPVTQ